MNFKHGMIILTVTFSTQYASAHDACGPVLEHVGDEIVALDDAMRADSSPISKMAALDQLLRTKNPAFANSAANWAVDDSGNKDIQNLGFQSKFLRAKFVVLTPLSVGEIESGEYDVAPISALDDDAKNAIQTRSSISIELFGSACDTMCYPTYFQHKECQANFSVTYGDRTLIVAAARQAFGSAVVASDNTLIGMFKFAKDPQGRAYYEIPARAALID